MPASLTVTGNTNDAIAAIAKLERQYDNLENKIKRSGTVAKHAADLGASGFQSMAIGAQQLSGSLLGIGGSLDLIVKGVDLAKQSFDDLERRENRALDSNVRFAQSLTKLALASDVPVRQAEKLILDLSKQTNVQPQNIPEMLNRFQAAKGPTQGHDFVEKTFRAAAKLAWADPESMSALGEASLDITKQNPGTTPEQAIGFSLAAQKDSGVPDPVKFNQNVMPALLGGQIMNGTPLNVGAAISNALTQTALDKSGRRSRTAQIALEMQLANAFPEMEDTLSRINFLRGDPSARDSFMKGLKNEVTAPDGTKIQLDLEGYQGEKSMRPAIQAMLTKDTPAANIFDTTLQTLVPLERGDEEFNRRAVEMKRSGTMQIAGRHQSAQIAAETARIGNKSGAAAGAARQGFYENLQANDVDVLTRGNLGFGKWGRRWLLGQSEEEAASNTLGAELERMEGMTGNWRGSESGLRDATKYAEKIRNTKDAIDRDQPQDIPYTPRVIEGDQPMRDKAASQQGPVGGKQIEQLLERQIQLMERQSEILDRGSLKRSGQLEL